MYGHVIGSSPNRVFYNTTHELTPLDYPDYQTVNEYPTFEFDSPNQVFGENGTNDDSPEKVLVRIL